MTQNFKDMLYLFSCGALGITPEIKHNINVTEIYKSALSQNTWQTVFTAMSEIRDNEFLNWDGLDYNKLNMVVMQSAMANRKRLFNTHKFIEKLENEGVKCTILKGESLARYYKNPDCRISSDTDVLIDIKQEKKAAKIARKLGFSAMSRNFSSHHVIVEGENIGTIELHVHLYEEMFEDIWFDNKMGNCEPTDKMTASDGSVLNVLGVTDGAIFTTLHMIKHFLEKGVGVRQIMDTLIYLKSHKNEIDFNRFNEMMKHLKYDKFMDNIIGAGIKYFGFSESDFPKTKYDSELIEKIMTDVETGGAFGHRGIGGGDFYEAYTKERFDRFKNMDYDKYMTKVKISNYMKMMFPNKDLLKFKYPYVEKHKWLVPVAWIHRFIRKIFIKENNKISKVDPKGVAERMKLVKDLDMI